MTGLLGGGGQSPIHQSLQSLQWSSAHFSFSLNVRYQKLSSDVPVAIVRWLHQNKSASHDVSWISRSSRPLVRCFRGSLQGMKRNVVFVGGNPPFVEAPILGFHCLQCGHGSAPPEAASTDRINSTDPYVTTCPRAGIVEFRLTVRGPDKRISSWPNCQVMMVSNGITDLRVKPGAKGSLLWRLALHDSV